MPTISVNCLVWSPTVMKTFKRVEILPWIVLVEVCILISANVKEYLVTNFQKPTWALIIPSSYLPPGDPLSMSVCHMWRKVTSLEKCVNFMTQIKFKNFYLEMVTSESENGLLRLNISVIQTLATSWPCIVFILEAAVSPTVFILSFPLSHCKL